MVFPLCTSRALPGCSGRTHIHLPSGVVTLHALLFVLLLWCIPISSTLLHGEEHWAFQPPVRAPLPPIRQPKWPRHPIDVFILSRLEQERLPHAQEAGGATLLRRVTLALTGLPPTLDDIAAFASDGGPDAWERLIDRLLASPAYGERMAVPWLDLARYADTHGYHADTHREMWRWRDWVIDAWNRDLDFPTFTVEQLAGDLLPDATLEQRIATGFNRNHMINFENGAIADEYLVEYIADRVQTTATVWLGLTVQCARCHDHKHDPISQRDYFRSFAFFNGIAEQGLDGQRGNAAPLLRAPTRLQQEKLDAFGSHHRQLSQQIDLRLNATDGQQAEWERKTQAASGLAAREPDDTRLHLEMDKIVDGAIADRNQPNLRANVTPGTELAPGKREQAVVLSGNASLTIESLPAWNYADELSISMWVFPTSLDDSTLLARLDPDRNDQGVSVDIVDQHLEFRMQQDGNVVTSLVVRCRKPLLANRWQHIAWQWDGTNPSQGPRCYLDGELRETEVTITTLTGPLQIDRPLMIGNRIHGEGFRGLIDDVRIYGRLLSQDELTTLSGQDPLRSILAISPSKRSPLQARQIRQWFLESTDERFRKLLQERAAVERDRQQLEKAVPTTMVMQELPQARPTFVLKRGQYDQPAEQVTPGLPEVLHAPPMNNRLEMARWLGSAKNPFGSRAMVNRLWQLHFGRGLITTPDDLGHYGELPSHPQLLDWLAHEFQASSPGAPASMKRLQRQVLLSATYRQASDFSHAQDDPNNVLLGRGPRLRLTAEMIRDQGLAASGLLDRTVGGRSVFPYQPDGLWEEVAYDTQSFTAQTYKQGHGADLYRRGLYTFWKRAVPPTLLATWDAPDREVCTVTRSQTNTPLQALAIMNEPSFMEASRYLAANLITRNTLVADDPDTARRSIREAFQRIVSRTPNDREMEVLLQTFHRELAAFQEHPEAAAKLLAVGESPLRKGIDAGSTAALACVISAILSLDEALSSY